MSVKMYMPPFTFICKDKIFTVAFAGAVEWVEISRGDEDVLVR